VCDCIHGPFLPRFPLSRGKNIDNNNNFLHPAPYLRHSPHSMEELWVYNSSQQGNAEQGQKI